MNKGSAIGFLIFGFLVIAGLLFWAKKSAFIDFELAKHEEEIKRYFIIATLWDYLILH